MKKKGFGANGGFDSTKEFKEILRKKMGFEQTVDFLYKEKERILKKKMRFEANSGFL